MFWLECARSPMQSVFPPGCSAHTLSVFVRHKQCNWITGKWNSHVWLSQTTILRIKYSGRNVSSICIEALSCAWQMPATNYFALLPMASPSSLKKVFVFLDKANKQNVERQRHLHPLFNLSNIATENCKTTLKQKLCRWFSHEKGFTVFHCQVRLPEDALTTHDTTTKALRIPKASSTPIPICPAGRKRRRGGCFLWRLKFFSQPKSQAPVACASGN